MVTHTYIHDRAIYNTLAWKGTVSGNLLNVKGAGRDRVMHAIDIILVVSKTYKI
jgi:hypothetical protein